MELPKDPFMLLSVINMKLRDNYTSLEALCEDMEIDQAALRQTLEAAGFTYEPTTNRFC